MKTILVVLISIPTLVFAECVCLEKLKTKKGLDEISMNYWSAQCHLLKKKSTIGCFNREKGKSFLEKNAELGDAKSMFELGNQYFYEPNAGDTERKKAFNLFKKAAELGHPMAMEHLAYCYKNSWGTNQDLKSAKTWFEKAAQFFLPNSISELKTLGQK